MKTKKYRTCEYCVLGKFHYDKHCVICHLDSLTVDKKFDSFCSHGQFKLPGEKRLVDIFGNCTVYIQD